MAERDILTMTDEELIAEVRKGHMAVAGFMRGNPNAAHDCLRAFDAFGEMVDRFRVARRDAEITE